MVEAIDPLASNRSDGIPVTAFVVPSVVSIVLPGESPGVVPSEVINDVPVVVSSVKVVVVGSSVVVGTVAGGGSSHLSQMLNPSLLFGLSVGSFV